MRKATHSIAHIEPKHLAWFVAGAVHAHCDRTGSLSPHETELRKVYIDQTLAVVCGYLSGQRDLDGSCSDMQCDVAMEARKVFRPRLEWKAEARRLLSVNEEDWRKRANAIKRVREMTGWGLRISAVAVDAIIRGDDPTKPVVDGGICEHCDEPNIDHMGSSNCRGR